RRSSDLEIRMRRLVSFTEPAPAKLRHGPFELFDALLERAQAVEVDRLLDRGYSGLLFGSAEQLPVAVLLLARTSRQAQDQLPLGEPGERLLGVLERLESVHPLGAGQI